MTDGLTRPARLDGRTAVVTGSSSGNGRLIALALAAEGARVVCSDVRPNARPGGYEEHADVATDELIRKRGGQAVFQPADVTVPADHEALADRAVDEFGRLDIWVNNAGIGIGWGDVTETAPADLRTILEVNVEGAWLGARTAIGRMREQDMRGRSRGRIVNLGSLSGLVGQAFNSIYSATKGAVHAITRSLAIEGAPYGINVNAVAPGYFPTAMTRQFWDDPATLEGLKKGQPWYELPAPEDVAGPVVFLASDEAVFVTGVTLPVDGGASTW